MDYNYAAAHQRNMNSGRSGECFINAILIAIGIRRALPWQRLGQAEKISKTLHENPTFAFSFK